MVSNTKQQFEEVIKMCRDLFIKKLQDYGPSWRIMRPESITDQIFIKARRIRTLEEVGDHLSLLALHAWCGLDHYRLHELRRVECCDVFLRLRYRSL